MGLVGNHYLHNVRKVCVCSVSVLLFFSEEREHVGVNVCAEEDVAQQI